MVGGEKERCQESFPARRGPACSSTPHRFPSYTAPLICLLDRVKYPSFFTCIATLESRSLCDHRAADNVACPQTVKIFVDVLEVNGLDGVANLATLRQRYHYAQIVVVPPEGTMIRVLASDKRKERQTNLVSNDAL